MPFFMPYGIEHSRHGLNQLKLLWTLSFALQCKQIANISWTLTSKYYFLKFQIADNFSDRKVAVNVRGGGGEAMKQSLNVKMQNFEIWATNRGQNNNQAQSHAIAAYIVHAYCL